MATCHEKSTQARQCLTYSVNTERMQAQGTGKTILRWVRTMRYNVLANLSVLMNLIIAHEYAIVKNYFQ